VASSRRVLIPARRHDLRYQRCQTVHDLVKDRVGAVDERGRLAVVANDVNNRRKGHNECSSGTHAEQNGDTPNLVCCAYHEFKPNEAARHKQRRQNHHVLFAGDFEDEGQSKGEEHAGCVEHKRTKADVAVWKAERGRDQNWEEE